MKVHKYYHHLRELIKENPKILDYDCIYSSDDEGHSYDSVNFTPSIGEYNKEDGEFYSAHEYGCKFNNALCVN
jgi:hypothetical protein